MKRLLLTIAFATGISAFAVPPAGFDARIEALRNQVGVPGMAIAIVENGKVTLAKGYGVKKLGLPEPVDADTIFRLDRPARHSPLPTSPSLSIKARSAGTTK